MLLLAFASFVGTARAFKVAESPLKFTDTPNKTEQKIVEEVVSENMQEEMGDVKKIPNPIQNLGCCPGATEHRLGMAEGLL